jgi:pimeloyl-ACP methyl ester carboxylesterase
MWDGVERRVIAANGIEIEAACAGHGRRLALLLHGWPEHAISWRHQIPLLVEMGYRVIAPNMRGYGASSSPPEMEAYAIETLIDDVVALIATADADEVVLVGHDWGGAIAWFVALRRPELIDRLIIMNLPHPLCFERELQQWDQRLKSWYVLFFQIPGLPEWLLTRNGAKPIEEVFRKIAVHKHRFPDAVIDVYKANALRPGGMRAMLNYYRAMVSGGGGRRQKALGFPMIDMPTLLIWGEQDTALSKATTRGTDAYVSDLTLRYIPNASHWVQQDTPDEVNAIVAAWLRGEAAPRFDS